MHFKILLSTLFILSACAAGTEQSINDDYKIGRKPEFFNANYLWGADINSQDSIAIIDQASHTLQNFSIEPFAHQFGIDLPLPYREQGVLNGVDSTYYVTIGEDEYAIISGDGSSQVNPVEILGKIETTAFDPVNHILVLVDEFKSMVLLDLDADGTINGSWKAGSLFESKFINAGTMLTDGRLILAMEDSTIAIVDVTASIEAQEWNYTNFAIADAESISWVASVPGTTSEVLLLAQDLLILLNLETRAVLDSKELTNSIDLKSRDYQPHVVTRATSEDVEVHYVRDSKLVSQTMRGPSYFVTDSWLDVDEGTITVSYHPGYGASGSYKRSHYADAEVYRFRLSDNLAIDKSETSEAVNLVVTRSFLFMSYNSLMGKTERRTYGKTPEIITEKAYNLDKLRAEYKDDN